MLCDAYIVAACIVAKRYVEVLGDVTLLFFNSHISLTVQDRRMVTIDHP